MEWNKNAIVTKTLKQFKEICYHYVENKKMPQMTDEEIEAAYYKLTGKKKTKKIKEDATMSK